MVTAESSAMKTMKKESPKSPAAKPKPKLKATLQPKLTRQPAIEQTKVTTKMMVHEAIGALTINSRKGVSLQAIKKYMLETHQVDTDKINFLIKKAIKSGVEDGSIIQTKGIGAAGSFKMASKKVLKLKEKPIKKKVKKDEDATEKKKKVKKQDSQDEKKTKKVKKQDSQDEKKTKKVKKVGDKTEVKKRKKSDAKASSKDKQEKAVKSKKVTVKESTKKTAKTSATPTKKKAALIKRKSIGSIIKAPKMKPKAMKSKAKETE